MVDLTEKELLGIEGGVIKLTLGKIGAIGGIITFLIGTLSGYLRPISCSSEK